ncbi:methyltransferase domain-containing protein [Micromonospora sp. NPDC048909]|uniref:methyltransferase domain-containing protein n=1 Tax=Micromonospora sp. NPDC048909 TaxID=3155643 RepID=UPI0033FD22BE
MSTHSGTDRMIRLLDVADDLPGAAALRARSYDLLAPLPDAVVVDVGCGTGRAVAELAARGARPIGVDRDERMVAVGRDRWPGADLRVGDALGLPLADGAVTGYRADKVLHELPDPAAAVTEAHRVLAPGGRIVLLGQDWDALIVDADDAELTRAVVRARADAITSPRVARRCRNLLLDAGFDAPAVEVHTGVFTDPVMLPMLLGLAEVAAATGAVAPDRAERWAAEQRQRAERDRLFLAVPMVLAAAPRP